MKSDLSSVSLSPERMLRNRYSFCRRTNAFKKYIYFLCEFIYKEWSRPASLLEAAEDDDSPGISCPGPSVVREVGAFGPFSRASSVAEYAFLSSIVS